MWDTLADLLLLLAIGGWLTLWLLRDLGALSTRRGKRSATRPTDPSSSRGAERIVPDGDQTTRQSPKNPARRRGDRLAERPGVSGRHLESGSHQPSATQSLTKASRSNP